MPWRVVKTFHGNERRSLGKGFVVINSRKGAAGIQFLPSWLESSLPEVNDGAGLVVCFSLRLFAEFDLLLEPCIDLIQWPGLSFAALSPAVVSITFKKIHSRVMTQGALHAKTFLPPFLSIHLLIRLVQ